MNKLRILKNWLTDGCIYYTVISAVFLIISLLMGNDASKTVLRESSFLLMLPCGLVISMGTQIARTEAIARWARILCHYLFTVLALFLFIWLPSDSIATPMAGFLMLVMLTVIYWVAYAIRAFILSRKSKRK